MKQLLTYILLTVIIGIGFSQSSQESFGKNRVQYKKFEWKFISTKHFNIHYYGGGANIAHNAARIAEEDYDRISQLVGYSPYQKITLMVYNSPGDLRQSNIGLQNRAFVGGETQLIKSKKEIAFHGDYNRFKKDISETVADMLINMMLFGGSLKEVVESSYLLNIPEWFVSGAAAYIGRGWDTEMDDAVRDLVIQNDFNPRGLIGENATVIGQSIWSYMDLNYGSSTISNVLNLSRILRNEETSIANSTGLTYKEFINDWQTHYKESNLLDSLSTSPNKKLRARRHNRRDYHYNSIAYNKDSTLVAYSENNLGRHQIKVLNTVTGKKKSIYVKGNRLVDQKVDYDVPLVAWRSTQELSIMSYKKGKPFLFTKNLQTGKKEKKYFNTFDQITSFDYNQLNKDMVLTAYKNGQSDVYIYDYKDDKATRITKDLFDDRDVQYIPGTYNIIFSSNRLNDTLRQEIGSYNDITNNYNLFIYDSKNRTQKLNRITNFTAPISKPIITKNGELFFLMDWKHSIQLYQLDTLTNTIHQKTNFSNNLTSYGINLSNGRFSYVTRLKGKQFLYHDSLDINQNIASFKMEDFEPKAPKIEEPTLDELLKKIDLNNLTFASDSLIKEPKKEADTSKKGQYPNSKIYGPFPSKLEMGVDYVVTSLEIDQLRGVGVLLNTRMSDVMSNHRVNMELFAVSDLKSSSFSGEYELLKFRNDFRAMYDRKSLFTVNGDFVAQNYTRNTIEAGIAHPFNEASRVSFNPFYTNTKYVNHNIINLSDSLNQYLGFRLEYVFDNTKEHGLNMLDGTRIKIQFSSYNHFGKKDPTDPNKQFGFIPGDGQKDFGKFNVDIRKYFKLYKQVIFATRASFGQFVGPSKKNFLLGGMDNWLFASNATPSNDGINPLNIDFTQNNSDLMFLDYGTNMRGFKYNSRFGNRYLLANSEVRLPIAKILHKGPMGSSFFRNLQFVGFYDVGTTWNTGNPFSINNDQNTRVVQSTDSPFKATVTNYENPFLIGYGFGARTMLFGYYLKFDVAWGIENFVNQGREMYLTFGYDF